MPEQVNTAIPHQTSSWNEKIKYLQQLPLNLATESATKPEALAQPSQGIATAIEILQNGDFQQQWEVAKILPKLGPLAIAPLIALVEAGDASLQTRWFAAKTLGKFDDPTAVVALVQLLQTTTDEDLVNIAAKSLAEIGDAAVASIQALLANSNSSIHLNLVQALAYIRSRATIEPLLQLANHADAEIRACATEALGSFRDRSVLPTLINALQDKAAKVRKQAVVGLAGWVLPDLVELLQPLLYDHNLEVCQQTAIALGKISIPAAAAALGRLLLAPTTPPMLQLGAIRSLGWLELPSALDYLQQKLATEDSEIQRAIISAIGRTSSSSLRFQATRILTDLNLSPQSDSILKKTLATALGQLAMPDAIERLTELSQDESEAVRLHAIAALKKISIQQ